MKNVLCVANWPSDVGYAWWLMESYWVTIARYCHDHGAQCFLCYPLINQVPESVERSELICDELDVAHCSLLKLRRYLKSRRIKMVYLSDRGSYGQLHLKLKLAGARVVINHDHTPGWRPPVPGLKGVSKNIVNRMPLFSSNMNLAATEFIHQRMLQTGRIPANKVRVVKNGLPLEELPVAANLRSFLHLPDDSILAVSVGRATVYKGIGDLIDALHVVHQKLEGRLHIIHIGDGPDMHRFKAHSADLGLSRNMHFLGRRRDILSLLQGAQFAIHPSKGEVGYSLAILEHMYCGLPVIVPNNPSVCEATTHRRDGLLYSRDEGQQLSDALYYAATHLEAMQVMGTAARNKVIESYRLDAAQQALCAIVEELS